MTRPALAIETGLLPLLAVAYVMALRATLVVALTVVALRLARSASAAVRGAVAACGLLTLLALPLLRGIPTGWVADAMPAPLAAPLVLAGAVHVATIAAPSASDAQRNVSAPGLLTAHSRLAAAVLTVWAAGTLVVLTTLARGWAARGRLRRRATRDGCERWQALADEGARVLGIRRRVRVRRDPHGVVPLTWGTWRPLLIVPATADRWLAADQRAVVLHELAHVRACDALLRVLGRVACAAYWFVPGVWWLARRHQAEREQACDDRALDAGARASEYAECLLRLADAAPGRGDAARAVAVAATGASPLRERIVAALDRDRPRAPLGRASLLLLALGTVAVALPLGATRMSLTPAALDAALRDPAWATRTYAVAVLATRTLARRDEAGIARLAVLCREDPSPHVRRRAGAALAQLARAPR